MSSNRIIYAVLFGNLAVALTKFVAANLTRSSAMLSEGIHSLVDTGNQPLLFYGLRRAARRPDQSHPLGYGREVILTVHLAPREIAAALSLSFNPDLTTGSIAVAAIEARVRVAHPEIAMVFVKPQSVDVYRRSHAYFMVTADIPRTSLPQ